MKTKKRPKTGQYVMVWKFEGTFWSSTLKVNSAGVHMIFNEEDQEFTTDDADFGPGVSKVRYYV